MAARKNPKRGKAKTRSSRKGPGKGAGKKDGNRSQSFIGKVAQGILSRLIADGVKEIFGDIFGSEDFDFLPDGEDGEDENGEDGEDENGEDGEDENGEDGEN